MVLRNVPSTATFEEQRVEINELAADVEALDAAALKAESDTLQTVTARGFTTTNPIKLKQRSNCFRYRRWIQQRKICCR